MNFKKIVYATMMGSILLASSSCEKIEDFGDMNQNPNATTQPVPAALLTNVIAGMGNNLVWDQGGVSTAAGLYAQLFSETQYTETSRYDKPNFQVDGYYTGPLYDLQNIINFAGSTNNQKVAARIIKAHYFKFLTDAWGDLPYSEALKGGSGVNRYDKQMDIFTGLIAELKDAVDKFDNSSLQGDILYSGSIVGWRKYANSLRALIALQMSKVNPTLGRTEFAAALAHSAGVIENNADNAVLNYPGGNFPHPVYNYYNITQRTDYAVSKTLMDTLTSRNDPRRAAYASNTTGFPYGLPRDQAVNFSNSVGGNWARILAPAYRQPNSSMVIIGAANIWLARAEAAQRGWTTENVANAYQTGLQRSMEQWGVYNAGTFASYMAGVALTAGNELRQIALQEWMTWYPNGLEAFNVWRRTGFPVLTAAPGTTTGIPRRFPYGSNEYALNPANVAAAAAGYTVGGEADSRFARVWWDQ
jgi:hypothetical protein